MTCYVAIYGVGNLADGGTDAARVPAHTLADTWATDVQPRLGAALALE